LARFVSALEFSHSPSKVTVPDQGLKEHNLSSSSQYVARGHHSRRMRSKHTRQLGIAISSQGETGWLQVLTREPQAIPAVWFPPQITCMPSPFLKPKGRQKAFAHISESILPGKFSSATIFRHRIAAKTSGTASTFSLNPRASPHKTSQSLLKREASSYNQPLYWHDQVQ